MILESVSLNYIFFVLLCKVTIFLCMLWVIGIHRQMKFKIIFPEILNFHGKRLQFFKAAALLP